MSKLTESMNSIKLELLETPSDLSIFVSKRIRPFMSALEKEFKVKYNSTTLKPVTTPHGLIELQGHVSPETDPQNLMKLIVKSVKKNFDMTLKINKDKADGSKTFKYDKRTIDEQIFVKIVGELHKGIKTSSVYYHIVFKYAEE